VLQAIKPQEKKIGALTPDWLRLTFPADYRGSRNKVEVCPTAQTSLVISQEQLEDIRSRLRRAIPLQSTMARSFSGLTGVSSAQRRLAVPARFFIESEDA